jgi:hypothetical protein
MGRIRVKHAMSGPCAGFVKFTGVKSAYGKVVESITAMASTPALDIFTASW